MLQTLRVLRKFKNHVENLNIKIKHKGPLLFQMPCPQLLNCSLNMVNRVITRALCKTAGGLPVNVRGNRALFPEELRTAKQPPDVTHSKQCWYIQSYSATRWALMMVPKGFSLSSFYVLVLNYDSLVQVNTHIWKGRIQLLKPSFISSLLLHANAALPSPSRMRVPNPSLMLPTGPHKLQG